MFNLFSKKKVTLTPVNQAEPADAPIKILGGGCSKCNRLEANTKEAMAKLGITDPVAHVRDYAEIAQFGVMSLPALVVDGQVVASGSVLSVEDAVAILEKVRGIPHA